MNIWFSKSTIPVLLLALSFDDVLRGVSTSNDEIFQVIFEGVFVNSME